MSPIGKSMALRMRLIPQYKRPAAIKDGSQRRVISQERNWGKLSIVSVTPDRKWIVALSISRPTPAKKTPDNRVGDELGVFSPFRDSQEQKNQSKRPGGDNNDGEHGQNGRFVVDDAHASQPARERCHNGR